MSNDSELARVRAVAEEVFKVVEGWGHGYDCGTDYGEPCDCPLAAVQRAREQLGATQEQPSADEPASYPGELWSDGPYKEQLRYDRRDGRGGWGPW